MCGPSVTEVMKPGGYTIAPASATTWMADQQPSPSIGFSPMPAKDLWVQKKSLSFSCLWGKWPDAKFKDPTPHCSELMLASEELICCHLVALSQPVIPSTHGAGMREGDEVALPGEGARFQVALSFHPRVLVRRVGFFKHILSFSPPFPPSPPPTPSSPPFLSLSYTRAHTQLGRFL